MFGAAMSIRARKTRAPFDEAQVIKNRRSLVARAVVSLTAEHHLRVEPFSDFVMFRGLPFSRTRSGKIVAGRPDMSAQVRASSSR